MKIGSKSLRKWLRFLRRGGKNIEQYVFSIFHDLGCFHYEEFGSFDSWRSPSAYLAPMFIHKII